MVGGGNPLYLKFWVHLTLLERKCRLPINIRSSASAVTPSKKVQLTRIGSPLRAFQWS